MTATTPPSPAYADLDVVASLVDLPASAWDQPVKKGDVGTIVLIAETPCLAYIEFCDDEGRTRASPFMRPERIAPWVPPKRD